MSHPTINMLPSFYKYLSPQLRGIKRILVSYPACSTFEEVYNFRSDPRSVNATVLLTVDLASYTDPEIGTRPFFQGTPHPIAWFRDSPVDLGNGTRNGTMGGRMWMTSLGHVLGFPSFTPTLLIRAFRHTNATWESSLHIAHVQAGLQWVLESAT